MSEQIRLAANAVIAKVFTTNKDVKNIIAEALSYVQDGVEFTRAFKSYGWNGRSSFFSHRTCTFPAGFVHMVHQILIQKGYEVQIIKHPFPAPLGVENPIVDEFGNDDPRYDFQLKALRAVEKHGQGIIQVATGGGKTKIAKLIMVRYRRMSLFLTTRGVLMHQMRKSLIEAGFNVGVIGDEMWSPIRGINVGMVQTFVANLEVPNLDAEIRQIVKSNAMAEERAIKKGLTSSSPLNRDQIVALAKDRFQKKERIRARTIKLLEMMEVVIGEEAHEAGGNSYYAITEHCNKAFIRVALTATPFMRESAEDNMRLMAAFGPKLIQISEDTLIKRGILATPYFLFTNYKPHPKLRKTSPWQRAYQLGIVECEDRNEKILHFAKKASSYGLPVMILIQRKDHGIRLKKLLREHDLKTEFIYGDNNNDERAETLSRLGTGDIQVLIGTTILDVGVDVPAVGMVINAGGGKAEIGLRQRIGRGLRAKKTQPNACIVVEFNDDINTYLRDHARQRRAIIEATECFKERIIEDSDSFDWSIFSKYN
jgi:superfamily II DNA or RNA helicase